jgi:hypothetical protein
MNISVYFKEHSREGVLAMAMTMVGKKIFTGRGDAIKFNE